MNETYPLFTDTSVTKNDYQWIDIPPVPVKPPKIEYDPLDTLKPIERPTQTDLETLHPFKKDIYVPFGLRFRFKECVQINPYDVQEEIKLKEILFEETLKIRKLRQRTFIIPQIPLDDVAADRMYGPEGLAAHIYTSDWKQSSQYAVSNSNLKATSMATVTPEERRKIFVDRTLGSTRFVTRNAIDPMNPGFRKYVHDWQATNPVEFVDTTKLYWERNRDKGLCQLCDPPPKEKVLTKEEEHEIEYCLDKDLLRTPYTLHPPGYSGYVPKTPVNIKFRKTIFKKHEPLVSTLMEAQGVFDRNEFEK